MSGFGRTETKPVTVYILLLYDKPVLDIKYEKGK